MKSDSARQLKPEAGLVISQRWAERRRRILIITPANLRKQWHQELTEKFFLPCTLIESRSYNQAIKMGNFRPFEAQDTVVICSYHFARSKASDVSATPWDLVVIDEAHRLRNVYKPSNVIANTLKLALAQRDKLLLPGRVLGPTRANGASLLESITHGKQEAIQRTISRRNARFFEAEAEKLDGWADDLKLGLEREIK